MRRLFAALAASLFSLFVGLALLGYHAGDPSFNHRHSGDVQNWLGYAGSFTADLALQIIGLSSALLVLVVGWWAGLLWRNALRFSFSIRFIALLGALVTASGWLAFLSAPISWPIPTGLGGYVGFMLSHNWQQHGAGWLVAIAFFALMTACLSFALGQPLRGLYRHCNRIAMSLASFLGALVARARTAKREQPSKTAPKKRKAAPVVDQEDAPAAARGAGPKISKHLPKPQPKQAPSAEQSIMALPGGREGKFTPPSTQLLSPPDPKQKTAEQSDEALKRNAQMLEAVLQDFGVRGDIGHIRPGPVVTLYELEPAPGTKSSRVIGLADDIARSMSAVSARISVIPGRNALGIELPNKKRQTVYLRELLESHSYTGSKMNLPMALGHDIGGEPCIADLAKMPHLLVAGTTGSGKSVGINAMILSLLYHHSPDQCRFIMVDPKMLELSVYDGIPHLLSPVVTEPGKAVVALKWAVKEMENRYRLMSNLGVRNIGGYNQKIKEAAKQGQELTRRVQTGFDPETGNPIIEEIPLDMTPLPYIVVIVDEMADLMLVAGKDIEGSIQRLAQMARAAGIHMIMATQRPSVDVITGVIKANFPTRISFQVTSKVDSRTILGEMGAEQLLGMGDMLYMSGGSRITRVHGPFVGDDEVEKVVEFWKSQGEPDYIDNITEADDGDEPAGAGGPGMPDIGGGDSEEDMLFRKAVEVVIRDEKASTSYVQRRLKIGYNRAASLIERMEEEGIISAPNHKGKRELLLGRDDDA